MKEMSIPNFSISIIGKIELSTSQLLEIYSLAESVKKSIDCEEAVTYKWDIVVVAAPLLRKYLNKVSQLSLNVKVDFVTIEGNKKFLLLHQLISDKNSNIYRVYLLEF